MENIIDIAATVVRVSIVVVLVVAVAHVSMGVDESTGEGAAFEVGSKAGIACAVVDKSECGIWRVWTASFEGAVREEHTLGEHKELGTGGCVMQLGMREAMDVQAHFMDFKALIWVLEKSYDVILKRKEKVFLFIGTLPLRMGCDMACMEFRNVKNMVYYLMSPVGQASYAYLDSCLDDASYDNYDSSFSVDGDASSLCDHDTSNVCSSVSSPPCVEGRGNVCIWDFDHMDGPVESICGRPMVDMDIVPVFDVYDDDEGVAPIGDMIMSDMLIWDVESSQEEEPYVDMDAFMAINVAKVEEERCVMERASPMCIWLPMDGPIVVDTGSSCDDASSYDMVDDMHVNILDNVFFPPSNVLSWYPDDLWACVPFGMLIWVVIMLVALT
ncbi:hypothetical protein L7F22_027718 [Adiantum nelumboides]|nr:hypothetical protein [Adiantum nelumboides]